MEMIGGISYYTWEQDAPIQVWPAAVKNYVLLLTKGGEIPTPWVRAYGVDVKQGKVIEVIDVLAANLSALMAAFQTARAAHLPDSGTVTGQPVSTMKGQVPDVPPKGGAASPGVLDTVVRGATAVSTAQSLLFN